jgi:hypothetical protein
MNRGECESQTYPRHMDVDFRGGITRWEDPPPPRSHAAGEYFPAHTWPIVAMQLRANPYVWAYVGNDSSCRAAAPRINAGEAWWRPQGAYEAVLRTVELGDGMMEIRLYARYVGDPNEPPPKRNRRQRARTGG